MKVQVEELSPIERKLSIEVESAIVDAELSSAYAALGREVKIPGFRPGKVPRRILEQRFRDQVEGDVLQRVVEMAYLDAIRTHKVDAVASPQVTPKALKANQPFSFEARVEVKPKVEPKDYAGLELKHPVLKVEEALIDEKLEQLRKRMTRLEPVEGRDVAQADDYALVDYDAAAEGKPFPGSKAENVTVQVAPGEVVQGKVAALAGAKVGELKEIDYAFPADYGVAEVKGKLARFKMTLKALKREVVPELNDEFAQETGGGKTLQELRAKVRSDVERAQKVQADADERDAILKALVEKNAFEVPKSMVERAIDAMLEGALRAMARSGIDPRMLNLDVPRLREELRERAVREVKGTLLLEAIADAEKLEVAPEEIDRRIERIAEDSQQALSTVQKAFRSNSDRQALALRLREEKTIEFLKSRAKYS